MEMPLEATLEASALFAQANADSKNTTQYSVLCREQMTKNKQLSHYKLFVMSK
jgi:hypothetical protein